MKSNEENIQSSARNREAIETEKDLPTIVDLLDEKSRLKKDRWKILILKEIFSNPGITRKQLALQLGVRAKQYLCP